MCIYIHTCTRWKNYIKTRTTFCSVQPWWIPCAHQSSRICASTGAKVASKTWPIPSGKSRNTILRRPRRSLSISSSLGTTHLSNANYLHTWKVTYKWDLSCKREAHECAEASAKLELGTRLAYEEECSSHFHRSLFVYIGLFSCIYHLAYKGECKGHFHRSLFVYIGLFSCIYHLAYEGECKGHFHRSIYMFPFRRCRPHSEIWVSVGLSLFSE